MTTFDVRCPQCKEPVSAADVNLVALVAKCVRCANIFLVSTPMQPETEQHPVPRREELLPPIPRSIRVEGVLAPATVVADYRSYPVNALAPVRIEYRWFQITTVFALFFALVWDSFLVFWYGFGFTMKAPWIMLAFPIGHVAVGVAITKAALAGLFNRTTFDLDSARLFVKTGPIRWPWTKGSITIAIANLRQLAVLVHAGSKGGRTYGVIAHLHDGSTEELLAGLPDDRSARFIERAIERQLGLPDEPWLNEGRG